jgi:hypothetical protein
VLEAPYGGFVNGHPAGQGGGQAFGEHGHAVRGPGKRLEAPGRSGRVDRKPVMRGGGLAALGMIAPGRSAGGQGQGGCRAALAG